MATSAQKIALITGISGQDGSYLAELLLEKGYEVHGIVRRSSTFNTDRIDHIFEDPHKDHPQLILHYGDLSDSSNISRLMESIKPDEIYNLAAQSHVRVSFDIPEYTGDVTALGALRILDAIRETGIKTKFYQASSSEMFGLVQEVPQRETTPFYPRSPYGVAKVYGHWITKNYRESYNLFATSGILFNHESPRRGKTFVTRKITRGLSRIKLGLDQVLYLGNLDAKRDWGYAKDYVEGMWRMLQQDQPDDYVLATGETHTVREFVELAAKRLGMNIQWRGSGLDEEGFDSIGGKTIIKIDPTYFRPAEVELLIGDYAKAKAQLGWEPKITFHELVNLMVDSDLKAEGGRQPIKLIKSSFYHEAETKQALAKFILEEDILSMNKQCLRFEQSFAAKQQRKHAVYVDNGSVANLLLIQSMLNLGKFKRGDKIGFSALTWPTNVMPLIQLGLEPVAIDCRLETLNVSPAELEKHISGLKGLFLTNVLGFCDDLPGLKALCDRYGVILLEDNCESLGSRVGGRLLGNFGLASTFSFFVGHHMSTIEGGMITTDDDELRDQLVMGRAHGWDRNLDPATQTKLRAQSGVDAFYSKYTFYDLASNFRPTEINGFIGNAQIGYWDEIVGKRVGNFHRFARAMAANDDFYQYNLSHMDTVSNFSMPIICKTPELAAQYKAKFEAAQVEIRPVIAGNMTKQPFYQKYVQDTAPRPNSDLVHANGFYFGNNPEMTEDELATLCGLLAKE